MYTRIEARSFACKTPWVPKLHTHAISAHTSQRTHTMLSVRRVPTMHLYLATLYSSFVFEDGNNRYEGSFSKRTYVATRVVPRGRAAKRIHVFTPIRI